jgi:ribose transport system substrate-binding protein
MTNEDKTARPETTCNSRRNFLLSAAVAGAGSMLLPALSEEARAEGEKLEYVYLSIVTQVPFWVDAKAGLADAAKQLGVKTTFTGPLDFDTAAQARQLDELIARKPAGLLIFPGDANALAGGVARAAAAGIPVATLIGDIPGPRLTHLGIANFDAGKAGGEMLAKAIGGKGKVLLGTFPSPATLERVEGYKAVFKEKYPQIEVVDVINDKADPSFAPTAYAQAIQAHPDVAGIGGTDGDSGKGAAIAVTEAGRVGEIKIVAMDRNTDMLPYIANGTIYGSVAQKTYTEAFVAVHLLHWYNQNVIKMVKDAKGSGVNPLPENLITGVVQVNKENVQQFT